MMAVEATRVDVDMCKRQTEVREQVLQASRWAVSHSSTDSNVERGFVPQRSLVKNTLYSRDMSPCCTIQSPRDAGDRVSG